MKEIETPKDGVEIIEKRSLQGKHFSMPDGTTKVIAKLAPVHYTDENGAFQDVDTEDIRLNKNGQLVADKLPYFFTLNDKGIGFDYVSRTKGKVSVRLDQIDGVPFDRSNAIPVIISGNEITFLEVRPGLDISFKINSNGIRSFRKLKSDAAPKSFQWEIEHDKDGQNLVASDLNGKDSAKKDLQLATIQTPPISTGKDTFISTTSESWTGKVVEIDPVTRVKSLSDNKTFPVIIDPDITDPIAATVDDGTEFASNTIWHQTYISLATGYDPVNAGKAFYCGLRFLSLGIAQGATITLANLKMNCIGNIVAYGGGNIFGYASDNAAQFASGAGNGPKDRARTTANTLLPAPTSTGYKTYNVTTVVQEIINRAGWSSGNALAFILEPTGGPGFYISRFYDFSTGSTNVSILEVTLAAAPVVAAPDIFGIINNPIQ